MDTTTITDSASTNTVLVVTGLLLLAGVAMTGLTVWFWRSTRPDPEALGPLVSMSRRGFVKLDPIEQRRRLDQLRPGVSVPVVDDVVDLPEMLPPVDPVNDESRTVDPEMAESDIDDYGDEFHGDDGIHSEVVEPAESPAEISWDDDEWPDLDDWSDIESRSPSSKDAPARDVRSAPEPESRRRPGPIDPLLG